MSIMSNDQQNISSTLAFMKDDVLQQYAAMHKSDPYIFPLVFQESQNRKRVRMNQQMQMAGQQQPKVNEQALAQMAPPQARPMPQRQGQGIVDLSAPNMETMADGGIAGYPDDDFVTRNQSVVMMAGGGVARYNGAQGSVTASSELQSLLAARERYVQAGADTSGIDQAIAFLQAKPGRAAAQRAAADSAPPAQMPGFADQMAQDIAPAPTTATKVAPTYSPDNYSGMDRRIMSGSQLPSIQSITPPAKPAPKPDAERKPKPDTEAARKEPATTDLTGMYEQALKKADEKPNPLKADLEAINAAKVKAGQENVAGIEAIQKQFADIFKGRKDRLDTREGEIGKMKDQSLGLALLNAGAAMMSTRGSIGQAAGAGIDKFSQQYVAGLDKINAAKDKLSDARDRLEEIEAQRGELSARELHKARNEVKTLTIAGMENLVQAAMAERKMNRAEAIAFVEQQIKVSEGAKDRSSREGIARLQASTANRPGAEMQAVERIMAERKIPFTEALAVYKATQREPQTSETLLKAWSGNMLLQQQYPNPQDYIKMMAGSTGGASQLSPADAALVNKYSR